MQQDTESLATPTREWDMDDLLNSPLWQDMTFQAMLFHGSNLTRDSYLIASGIMPEDVTPEWEWDLPWDFRKPERRVAWEETQEPTIRDFQEYGLI